LATQLYADDSKSYPPAWIDSTTRWMDLLKPFIGKTSGVYLCPSDLKKIPVTWDTNIFLSYGINTFNFAGNAYCFWYGVNQSSVRHPSSTIIYADCTPGKYYCGGGSSFTNPSWTWTIAIPRKVLWLPIATIMWNSKTSPPRRNGTPQINRP
jgi:hypothetical protein